MSESVDSNTRASGILTVTRITSSGSESKVNANYTSYAQRQKRPKSQGTLRRGNSYVTPTSWTHNGAIVVVPTTSGYCKPSGLSTALRWEYFPGLPQTGITLPLNPSLASDKMTALVNGATTRALLNLKDEKVNLGVALAEAKEAAEMVANNARRIGRIFEGAYNRRPREWLKGVRNAGRNWKKVPSYYLEYVYGVAPIMSDVDGICQQLAESYNRGNTPYIYAQASQSDSEEYVGILSSGTQYGSYVSNGTNSLHAKVGLVAEVPSWTMKDYSSLGVTNPFSVAWERVGYSHVIDWFLPIGDWINTWDVSNYLRLRSGYTTRFIRTNGSVTLQRPSGNADWQVSEDLAGWMSRFSMTRTTMVTFPSASYPRLRNPLSLDHMAQGLAMLTNVIRGHKKLASRGPR